MFELSFGENAYILASHTCFSVALMLLIFQLLKVLDGHAPKAAIQRGLVAGLAIMLLGLLVERLYYITARLLKSHGLDLWQLHPAPEVLSITLLLTLYALKAPLYLALYPAARARGRLSSELGALMCLWVVVAVVLY